ncbi:MAG TPA: hypothetical protein VIX19_15190 [Terriglobales bacterium]
MARWIVFDELTAAELRSHLPREAVFEAPGRTAIEYALTAPRTVVTVLGPPIGDETAIAVFRPRRHSGAAPQASGPGEAQPRRDSMPVRASGFLGLSDQVTAPEEEENAGKKPWWQFWR